MQYEGNNIWSFTKENGEKIELTLNEMEVIYRYCRERRNRLFTNKSNNKGDDVRSYYFELINSGKSPTMARKITAEYFDITDKTVQRHIYKK